MRKYVFIALMLLVAVAAIAQDTQEKPSPTALYAKRNPYRLDFTIKELDDNKVVNTRSYSMVMESAEDNRRSYGEVKAGSRVPIVTANKDGQPTTQYMDVGVSIEGQLNLRGDNNMMFDCHVEVSSLVTAGPGTAAGLPIVRSVRSQTTSELVIGKTNQIASVDDPVSTHRFQIEVTATKLR